MSILTEAAYRQLTGDATEYDTGVLQSGLDDAQDLVGTFLRRRGWIESSEYTEVLVAQDGYVYPTATPVTVVPTGYAIESGSKVAGISGAVTYTGGWDIDTAPYVVKQVLAMETQRILAVRGVSGAGDGQYTDPEGNVVPVTPPFTPEDQSSIWAETRSYRKYPGAF